MSDDDNIVQSFYQDGVDYNASTNAGQWQAQNNPGYTPPQQYNESSESYQTRINAQYNAENSSSGK